METFTYVGRANSSKFDEHLLGLFPMSFPTYLAAAPYIWLPSLSHYLFADGATALYLSFILYYILYIYFFFSISGGNEAFPSGNPLC